MGFFGCSWPNGCLKSLGKGPSISFNISSTLFLGSNSSLNFSTKNYIVDSPNIKLGSNATEPLILGNKFLTNLNAIMTSLNALCVSLAASTVWPVGVSVPNAPEVVTSNDLIAKIATFVGQIESYKSTVSKTE